MLVGFDMSVQEKILKRAVYGVSALAADQTRPAKHMKCRSISRMESFAPRAGGAKPASPDETEIRNPGLCLRVMAMRIPQKGTDAEPLGGSAGVPLKRNPQS